MLIKNKNLTKKYIVTTKYFLNLFFKTLGVVFFITILTFLLYYFSSGMSQRYGAITFFGKINTVILKKYMGIDLSKIDQYFDILIIKTKTLIAKPKIDKIELEVNQKVILQLEKQRHIKITNNIYASKFLMHNILINNGDKKLKGKIRIKGDRSIHWQDKTTTSYKIDMRKNDRFFGLEEFSIQKPIARNYTYEYLFHKLLQETGQLSLKYFFINLYFNDENRGLYAVEESFSKELLERQKKRNGPIFGLDEEISTSPYPNVHYDLYSSQFWLKENPNLVKSAYSILNNLRDNEKDLNIEDHFDLDKWASFFALIDITGTYHGSLAKSVKLYFNPIQAKFEPIGFDGHYMDNMFEDFILSDFLQEDKIKCSYICAERDWYLKFFKLQNGELNYEFIKKYVFYLKKYSNSRFIKSFLNKNKKEIDRINTLIYSENSRPDRSLWKGFSTFIYDDQLLYKRSKLIEGRINSVNFKNYKLSLEKNNLIFDDTNSMFPIHMTASNCKSLKQTNFYLAGSMQIKWPNECNKIYFKDHNGEDKFFLLSKDISMNKDKIFLEKKFDDLSKNKNAEMISKNHFIISKNIQLTKNTHIPKNLNFLIKEGVVINIIKNSTLFVEGNIKFIGKDNNKIIIQSDGSGSLVFLNNKVEIKNMIVENLGYPKLNRYILYGGLNFINTELNLENISVKNSQSEDAINLIDSTATLKNISLENIESDAVDIDFGLVKFSKIICSKIKNDCLDISGSKIVGTDLNVDKSEDKGLSVGENSEVKINNIIVKNSKIGFAIKDGSNVYLENVKSINNQYDIAVFNKKQEFDVPFLEVKNFINKSQKILQSRSSKLIIDDVVFLGKQNNQDINSVIY